MNEVSVFMPTISIWELIAKIDNYWLVPIIIKITNKDIFACLYKDRFSPDFVKSHQSCRPLRISITYFTTSMGGNEVRLLWADGDWVISDENQVGLVPPLHKCGTNIQGANIQRRALARLNFF